METFDLRSWPGFVEAGGDASRPALVNHIAIDSRRIDSEQTLFIALKGAQDGHSYVFHAAKAGCKFALVSRVWEAPALPQTIRLLRVDDPLLAFQGIAGAYRHQWNIPVIAIIGSHGKTMVKDLLHAMLSTKYKVASSPESFNSQIGVPLSLLTIHREHEVALIEAAFSKPNEMDALAPLINPRHALLTHLGKKHVTTMGGVSAIADECIKMLAACQEDGWMLVPNDPLLSTLQNKKHTKVAYWDRPSPELPESRFLPTIEGGTMSYRVDFPDGMHHIGRIRNGFRYFLDLANMTTKAAWMMGVSSESISHILSQYELEPMRTEIWRSPAGATFINDTYCSDPQSIDLAIKHFDQFPPNSRKTFLFHGIRCPEEQTAPLYQRIGKTLHRGAVNRVLLVGNHAYEPLIREIQKDLPPVEIECFENLPEAYSHLRNTLDRDDVVLIKGQNKRPLDEIAEAFNDSLMNNQCVVNLAAVATNIEVIRKKLPPQTRLMVMVKALAYGTNDLRMANFLKYCGVDLLGVSYVDEAAALREAGVSTPLFVINAGIFEAKKVVKWDLEVAVSEIGLIQALSDEAHKAGRHIKVHLHVNTGMSRLGCRPEEALSVARHIMHLKSLQLEGIMTHFASAEDPKEDSFTQKQASLFVEVIEALQAERIDPPWKHAANSSGALRFYFPRFNMVRIGLAAYGLHASGATEQAADLRLAFSLLSRIVGINVCKRGETVSYGRSYEVSRDEQRIAVLPIGYFDGLHRNYSGKGHVIIRGQKAPMVGRITMDYMMVDVTDIPHAAIGDPVLLFGEDEYGHYMSPEDFAFEVDSIPHELITCIGPRIQRVFIYEEALEKRNIPGVCDGCLSKTT